MTTKEKDVLTIAEVAERLGMGLRQTYRYARSGELPFVCRIGTRFITPRRAFERWLDTAGHNFARRENAPAGKD